jgi:SAM-dependent methyltransferase
MSKLTDWVLRRMPLNRNYRHWVKLWRLKHLFDKDKAMQHAIGGEFIPMGILERELLIKYGLKADSYVIDVGCGAGRLAKPLSEFLTSGRYLGTDVVPDLLRYARGLVSKPDWRFEVVNTVTIPEDDDRADIVCFFSVLTHLLHENSYLYLQEAKRVLKNGGRIVFSFLEFAIPCHWTVFENTVRDAATGNHPLNVFLSREAIASWAAHLGLEIEAMHDGDSPFIPLPYPVKLDSGVVFESVGALGQSVCVLKKT